MTVGRDIPMKKNIMEWWHSQRLEAHPYAVLVMMMLAVDADATGQGKTSRKRLARDTNLAEKDVINRLIDLEKQKLLQADIDERGAINYQLNIKKKGERAK